MAPSGVLTKRDVPMHCRQVPKPVRWKTCQRQNQYEERKAWPALLPPGRSLFGETGRLAIFPKIGR